MHILWDEWAEKYRVELLLALAGITLVGIGLFWWKGGLSSPDSVQILSASDTSSSSASLVLDISGSVQRPGVYELPPGSRIEDAIQAAGGISEVADTDWITLNLNRAEKVKDGMKIFIPADAVIDVSDTNSEANAVNNITAESKSARININAATSAELDTLSGVGPVTAGKIIDNRPYSDIDQLLVKKVVSQKVFDQIKLQISVW